MGKSEPQIASITTPLCRGGLAGGRVWTPRSSLPSLKLTASNFLSGKRQVSPPAVKLQKTRKASREQPWLGSIQYSPGKEGRKDRQMDRRSGSPLALAKPWPATRRTGTAWHDIKSPPFPRRGFWCPLSLRLVPQNLTVLEVRVAKLQLPADPRGALGGAQGPSQLLHLGAQGAERRVHLLQPLVIQGGSLLPRSPFGCPPVPPAPARGQRLEQLSWAALRQRGMKG